MTRWTDFHELSDRAKLLIFGTTTPTKAQIALYQVGQFKCRVVVKLYMSTPKEVIMEEEPGREEE